jgi:lipid-A-disaccharide synthase
MRIMISCGEASGDLYAGALADEIRRREPGVELIGFGGPRLRAAGATLIGEYTQFAVTGLTEAVRVIPRSLAMIRRLVAAARARRPDVFVAIDFPDFNFRLMSRLRRLGVPVVYYVSPQLWAWRSGRMKTMQRDVGRVLVIFPFEEPIYREADVNVRFVGHPLVDLARPSQLRESFLRDYGLNPALPTVALLPGSRRNELERIVPVIAEALPRIQSRVPGVQFTVACAPSVPDTLFGPLKTVSPLALIRDRTDDVIASADVAITASGTATVQCALHERPMVVVYRLSSMTYRLGKPFVKVSTYAMPNLIAGRQIVPELIQDDFTAARVADETVSFLTDRRRYDETCTALRQVRERLGAPGASARAAAAVLDVARNSSRNAVKAFR